MEAWIDGSKQGWHGLKGRGEAQTNYYICYIATGLDATGILGIYKYWEYYWMAGRDHCFLLLTRLYSPPRTCVYI